MQDPGRPAPADLPVQPAAGSTNEATFVLDRDLRVHSAPLDLHVRHWMELVDLPSHGTAYAAFARALVGPGAATCRLRFSRAWSGRELTCTVLRDLERGGFLVRVRVATD